MKKANSVAALSLIFQITVCAQSVPQPSRPRVRDIGMDIGILPTGALNAITDVAGVEVGHTTLIQGDNVRTGVTAILPHSGNLFKDKVPGAVFVGNGFGKLSGSTQVNELGEIETPILLTNTLSVPRVADALMEYMLSLPGNEEVKSVNPLVAETNDGKLNDIRGRRVSHDDVFHAINTARAGLVEEGCVGAGTGTVAFGFKGGIGTSSRKLPPSLGGYTVGVLVQSNFPGVLSIGGAPVGQELGRYYLKEQLSAAITGSKNDVRDATTENSHGLPDDAGGSVIVVVATDAPLDHHSLLRLASRAMLGLARAGSSGSNESGDYAIAFSTAPALRIESDPRLHPFASLTYPYSPVTRTLLSNDGISPLFLAVIEATEEAVDNSLFRATTMTGQGHTADALPIAQTVEILRRHGFLNRK